MTKAHRYKLFFTSTDFGLLESVKVAEVYWRFDWGQCGLHPADRDLWAVVHHFHSGVICHQGKENGV